MLRSANLESRQSELADPTLKYKDAPLREFGIKAKPQPLTHIRWSGCSAPRIWNQGKACGRCGRRRASMLRSANLESRQSIGRLKDATADDAPLREFGIKAKRGPAVCAPRRGCSAPRIWNQGKASPISSRCRSAMLRSANLESRQSLRRKLRSRCLDAPLREFGIKAKHGRFARDVRPGCSAPRIWNQGKARNAINAREARMLRSANLESRQSSGGAIVRRRHDAPLREFGIKAKPLIASRYACRRCSAPRIWNQGKARKRISKTQALMLRSANLESRQSSRGVRLVVILDAPLREFGIKAKHRNRAGRNLA